MAATVTVKKNPAKPGKAPSYDLLHEDRMLDPNNCDDLFLAGRCLRYMHDTNGFEPGVDGFQIWVNWARRGTAGVVANSDLDLPKFSRVWAQLALRSRPVDKFGKFQKKAAELTSSSPDPRERVQLKVKRLDERAVMPTFGTPGAACFDLYAMLHEGEAAISTMPYPNVTLDTGLAFEVPEGWVMKLYSRSGQGFKDNTRLANCVGIIDSDYRGPLRVKLTRDDGLPLFINHGDRVAQAMLERVPVVEFVEVDELSETQRGDGAYGSTGR